MLSINTILSLSLLSTFVAFTNADFLVAQGLSCGTEADSCTQVTAAAPIADGFTCSALVNPAGTFTEDTPDTFHITSSNGSTFCGVAQLNGARDCDGCATFSLTNAADGSSAGFCDGAIAGTFQGFNPDGEDDSVPTDYCVEGVTAGEYEEDWYCTTWGAAATC